MGALQLSTEDYRQLHDLLLSIGYRKIPKKHKSKNMVRLDISAPRKLTGSETGFMYSNNGYESIIWVSYLEREQKFRETGEDAGWAIIISGDELVYTARPISRTKGFVLKIARYAWVNKFKVDNIPLCPCDSCSARMSIYRKEGTRQYMYICTKKDHHADNRFQFRSWDFGVPPKAMQFLEIRRNLTEKYKKKNDAAGKSPIPKAITRKKWKIGRPDNVIKRPQ